MCIRDSAATAKTVLLLLISVARSIYGMASAGVLPRSLGQVGGRGIPNKATAVVLLMGNLEQVATMTTAAILTSFLRTNASLRKLAVLGLTSGDGFKRVADII